MRAVVITNGHVTNVVEVPNGWSPESVSWQPPHGSSAFLSEVGEIGDTYSGGVFHKPDVPVVVFVPQIISDRQFYQQLAVMSLITEEEALAAVMTGTIPVTLQGLVDQMPADQQFGAKMLLSGAVSFSRTHMLTETFGLAMGWSSQQLDELWIAAGKL